MARDGNALLIIGNGFDLQCGLKSSYADFFDWLRQDEERANNNLWAVHFLSNQPKGQNWVDVENGLQRVLSKRTMAEPLFRQWPSVAENNLYTIRNGYPIFSNNDVTTYIMDIMAGRGKDFLTHTGFWMN